ncbi:MAG: hypothetical protein Q9226_005542, partial [Calogaya cf. arnoldii]
MQRPVIMTESKELVLITGANGGIGFELTRQLLADPKKHVLLGSRSIEKGETAIKKLQSQQRKGTVELVQVDVTSEGSVGAAAKEVEKKHGRYVTKSSIYCSLVSMDSQVGANHYNRLDALVNNAGIVGTNGTNAQQLNACLQTNAVGAQLMGDYFAPLLRKSTGTPRILNVTSGAGSISVRLDRAHPSAVLKATPYRISKAAMNMVAACQWYDLGEEGFKIFIYGPGYTESNLSASNKVALGAKPTSEG